MYYALLSLIVRVAIHISIINRERVKMLLWKNDKLRGNLVAIMGFVSLIVLWMPDGDVSNKVIANMLLVIGALVVAGYLRIVNKDKEVDVQNDEPQAIVATK
jgi:hypothetical protein